MNTVITEDAIDDEAGGAIKPHSGTSSVICYRSTVPRYIERNERLVELMRVPTTDEMEEMLAFRGVPNDPELWNAEPSRKFEAMASFDCSYAPTTDLTTFSETFFARYRRALSARNFDDEEYRAFFFAARDVMKGARLRPLPASMNSLKGTGIMLSGPSLMGRSALLQRYREILKMPFRVYGEGPEPAMMWVIPGLNINYPVCGTLKGLLVDLRHAIIAAVGRADTPVDILPEFRGDEATNAAISACILLNVGVLMIDGASFASLEGQPLEILRFLVKFQQYSGIPVVLSGTPAFMHIVGLAGSKASNLFNGLSHHFDPFPPPVVEEESEKSQRRPVWTQLNLWLWSLGLFSPENLMPVELPMWTHEFCVGRTGWLVQGFEALHTALIRKPSLLQQGALTKELVARIFEQRLRLQRSAREVAAECMYTHSIEDKTDFFDYIDHLPLPFIRKPEYRKWLQATER